MEPRRIFITGASGYIGSAVSRTLIERGHLVRGLARSKSAEQRVTATGADVVGGDLQAIDVLASEAARSDVVIHLAATGDADTAIVDEHAVNAMLSKLGGRRFIATTATVVTAGSPIPQDEENMNADLGVLAWLGAAEKRVLSAEAVSGVVVRAPMVYGDGAGPVERMIEGARGLGQSRYISPGDAVWSTVHVRDLSLAYALLAESTITGSFHAAEWSPVSMRALAEAVAAAAQTSVGSWSLADAVEAQGPLASMLARDTAVSSKRLIDATGWSPEVGNKLEGIVGYLRRSR